MPAELKIDLMIVLAFVAFALIRCGLFRINTYDEIDAPPSAHGTYPIRRVLRARNRYLLSGVVIYCLGLASVSVLCFLAASFWLSL